MLILRQKMVAKPDKSDELMAALAEIITPARATEGVISLDIAHVLLEPDSFIATAVYEDHAALERQESRPEVHKVVAMLAESLAAPLERTIFDATASPAAAVS
jgi:quinol monooxygenase YgiN